MQHTAPATAPRGGAAPAPQRSAQKAPNAGGGVGSTGEAAVGAVPVAPVPASAAPPAGGGGPTASKNSGSELFDALLIAATGGESRHKYRGLICH